MSVASNHEKSVNENDDNEDDDEWEWDEDTDVLKDITNAETLFAQHKPNVPNSQVTISHQQVQNRVTEISEQPARKRRSNDSSNNLEGKARILFGI